MLNWIAIWVGVFLFGLGRAAPERHAAVRARLERHPRRVEAEGLLGRPAPAGRSTSASSSRSPLSSSTGSRSTGRRSATRCARSASTPRRRATAASPSRGTTSSRWRSRALFAGLAGAIDIVGWQFRINTNDVLISSRSASSGSPSRCSAATRRSAIGLAALLFAALITGTSTRNLDPEIFKPELASNLTRDDPGARRALRRRRRAHPVALRLAEAAAAASGRGRGQ